MSQHFVPYGLGTKQEKKKDVHVYGIISSQLHTIMMIQGSTKTPRHLDRPQYKGHM